MTTTRTDIHRPSAVEFDPQAYELDDVYDLFPPDEYAKYEHARRIAAVARLKAAGYSYASHQLLGQCGHCGARIRYAALMVREDVHEMIYVGETCLDHRFQDLTKAQFQHLRKQAQLDREKQAKLAGFNQFLADHPEIVPATYVYNVVFDVEAGEFGHEKYNTGWATSVIADIMSKARMYGGQVSDKQIAFVVKLMTEIEEKVTNYVPPVPAGDAPRGKQTIEGEFLSSKAVEGYMGGTAYKMVVKLDNGSRVYGTIPMSLSNVEKGQRIRFTATFEAAQRDPQADFAFFKRPSSASVL